MADEETTRARQFDELRERVAELELEIAGLRGSAPGLPGDDRFRRALTQAPIVLFEQDLHLRYTWVFNSYSIYSSSLALGRTDSEIMPGEHGEKLMALKRKLLSTGKSVREEVTVSVPGRSIEYDLMLEPLRDSEGRLIGLSGAAIDVTEWKNSEAALRQSEERFRTAFEHAQTGMAVKDLNGRFLRVNRWFCEITGHTDQELFGMDFIELTHPDDIGSNVELMKRMVAGEIPAFVNEKRYVRKDGKFVWVKNSVSLARDPQGNPANVIAITEDITERKRAEETLLSLSRLSARIGTVLAGNLHQQEMLDRCADLMVSGLGAAFVRVWLIDPSESVLELCVSRGQYTHLDGKHSRIPVGEFKIGLIAKDRTPHLTNAVVGDPQISEQDWARREGMVAFAGYPLVVGERLEGVMALFSRSPLSEAVHFSLSSISDAIAVAIERKRGERELRAVEERNRKVLESITDAFYAVDREWRFTYLNQRAEELIGRSTGSLIGRNLWEVFPEAVGTIFEQNYRKAMETGPPVSFDAYFTPLKLWIEVHAYPSDQGLSVYFQDIGERKRLEDKLRETAKLESLGVMAGGIAHDFNNLLTGIMGNASLLVEGARDEDRPLAEDIVKASERAADLTRQMLAYSGKGRFEIRRIDLSAQVREMLRLVKPMIGKHVEIELNLAGEARVEADPGQMQQLLMNLVINAAESLEEKPGRVIITTAVHDVDETILAQFAAHDIGPGRYVWLEVQDTGSGMSEETKAKIFDPFFTTKFTGRGLGLAAVSGIVRGHKGALRVYSSLGEGTTFKVLIPAVDTAPRAQELRPAAATLGGKGTILLVDDEQIVRQIGRTTLERQGYTVLVASDGLQAVEMFDAHRERIALVILDMTMPVMRGEDALDRLRAIRPDLPVIVSSGYNEVEVIRRFTSQGIAAFVQKPYSASTLAEKVKSVLENRSTSQR